MDAIKDGGPAFPKTVDWNHENQDGMTLRDWFAGKALIGELASSSGVESAEATAEASIKANLSIERYIARVCYNMADAMIEERMRRK